MSYNDPYSDQNGGDSGNPYYNGQDGGQNGSTYDSESMQQNLYQIQQTSTWSQDSAQYGNDQPVAYQDTGKGSYHSRSYGHGSISNYGYQSSYKYPPVQRSLTNQMSEPGPLSKKSRPSVEVIPVAGQHNLGTGKDGFDKGEFTPSTPKRYRTPSAYRAYRYDNQGRLWTKGGLLRTIGRFFVCSVLITLFLLVSIVLSLVLWIRPPNIQIGSVQANSQNGSVLQTLSGGGWQVNLAVPISVENFNYFDVVMRKIQADVVYPINNTPIGGGTANNIAFNHGEQTNFTFPFTLTYSPLADASGQVLADIAKKCGALGGQKQDLSINYKITLGIQVLLFTISPTISNVFTFACPIKSSDVSKIIQGS